MIEVVGEEKVLDENGWISWRTLLSREVVRCSVEAVACSAKGNR
jgi:hypothetical protein